MEGFSGCGTERGRRTQTTVAPLGCSLDNDPFASPLVDNKVVGRRSNDENSYDVGLGTFEIGYSA